MARISLKSVCIDYPVYNTANVQLRNRLIELGTGGIISRGSRNIVTIRALDGVSAVFEDGDSVGLVGHNGAGKTTFLRTLAGIYSPKSGEVSVEGRISSIFQLGAGISPELNGYENVIRLALYMGVSRARAKQIIPDVEEFTELGDFMSMPVLTYSAGMVTRLTFAVATAVEPDIILIDEVLSAGDEAFQIRARERLEHIMGSAKIMVLASHSHQMIELYCNRVLEFEHGKLVGDRQI